MEDNELEFPEKTLYCAACEKHYEEMVKVKIPTNEESKKMFFCPRSMEMTHYGPWGYAIDEAGKKYEYQDEELVRYYGSRVERLVGRLKSFFTFQSQIS